MESKTKHNVSHDIPDLSWLKTKYFSNPGQKIELEKGAVILSQNQKNQRIYYLESGQLSGYFQPDNEEAIRMFTVHPHMIAGIYSFFSPNGCSYTTVTADEASVVYYVDKSEIPNEQSQEYSLFLQHMLPVIVNEIYVRQMLVSQNAMERQSAMKKLFQTEKLATLGQLAAGLAHELNNAIGVLQNKTLWLTDRLQKHFASSDESGLVKFFESGLKSGQSMSSKEVRERKRRLQKKTNLDDKIAKRLAKIHLSDEEIAYIAKRGNTEFIEKLDDYWEVGLALHDMSIASDHTNHVIKSIKELGSRNLDNIKSCDLNESISKSLALLVPITKHIEIEMNLEDNLKLDTNEGNLIQVWVNLIKNAAECLTQDNIQDPKITIESKADLNDFEVTVSDNGSGIDKDILPTIFQPNVTTKVSGMSFGLGLGLSIVQKIVIAIGGSVSVVSAPGKTSFTVLIPK